MYTNVGDPCEQERRRLAFGVSRQWPSLIILLGVSLITQVLYAVVFCMRYLDLFWDPFFIWNTTLKIFYIFSSFYIILLMMRVFARTREREKAWKLGAYCFIGSMVAAPVLSAIFLRSRTTFIEVGQIR